MSQTYGMTHEDRALVAVVRPTGEVEPAWVRGPVANDIVSATRYAVGEDRWTVALNPVIKPRAFDEGWRLAEPYFQEAGMMEEFKYWMDINKRGVRSANNAEDVFHEYYVPDAIKADAAERKSGARLVAPRRRDEPKASKSKASKPKDQPAA